MKIPAWLQYFGLFFGYLLSAQLLSNLSFQAQIVPIWLPAGFALIGCYFWWWRFAPAVFIASFIFNCSVVPDFSVADIYSDIGLQNTIIAAGSTLQALVGGGLLRYWLTDPLKQSKTINTLYFVVIVGILVNLLAASIGVYSLSTFNPEYSLENYWQNIIFWWLGDSLGVLLVTPFILSFIDYNQLKVEQKKSRNIIKLSVVFLFTFIVFMTAFFVDDSTEKHRQLVQKEVIAIENSLNSQLNANLHRLQKLATYMQDKQQLSRESFQRYVDQLIANEQSIRAMSWNPLIYQHQVAQHQNELTKIYQRDMVIRGEPLTANDPIVYIKYISPEPGNEKAIGFNIYSNPSRKASLIKTKVNYLPMATPIIQLVQSNKKEPGYLLFTPVFEHVLSDDGEQVKRLKGLATGVFLAEQTVESALSDLQQQLFDYEVHEKSTGTLIAANTQNSQLVLTNNANVQTRTFDIAGQQWQINMAPNQAFLAGLQNESYLVLFLLKFSIVTIVMFLILLMNNRHVALNQLVNERTESLSKAMDEANHANQAKSQFLANMSHEIRTPLNSVIGFAQLANKSDDMFEIKDFLEKITISSDLLINIVNDILDISKIESEKLVLANESFDFCESLNKIDTIFAPTAANKQLTWHLSNQLPKNCYYLGDQTRVEQILINLCGNAIKFTSHGGIAVSATITKKTDISAVITVDVKDSGVGISPEYKKTLFSPFTQADASTSRVYGGTGLGLTISKKLSQLMLGDIVVESELTKGSTFSFSCQLTTTEVRPEKQAAVDSEYVDLSALKVLVAEDNRVNQTLIKTILGKLSVDSVIVDNGQLAVERIQQQPFDVILMDCQMPVLDGYQATQQIRAIAGFEKLPIIALTADVDVKSKAKAKDCGFSQHLSKPINLDLLAAALQKIADLKQLN